MRIDLLLWRLRLTKTRNAAQALVAKGHVRIDGQRVEKPHAAAHIGHVITLPWGHTARVIRLLSLPLRRGPATEARACYAEIGEPAADCTADSGSVP